LAMSICFSPWRNYLHSLLLFVFVLVFKRVFGEFGLCIIGMFFYVFYMQRFISLSEH